MYNSVNNLCPSMLELEFFVHIKMIMQNLLIFMINSIPATEQHRCIEEHLPSPHKH